MIATTVDPIATPVAGAPELTALAGPAALRLNAEPRRGDVLREQLAAVGLTLRGEAAVVAGIMAVFSAVVLTTDMSRGFAEMALNPRQGFAAALVALLIPMAVWKGESPDRRGYHHAMPVGHGEHAVARAGAGLVWTLAWVAAFFAWMALLALVTGGGVDETEPWQWAAPFAGATALYLLGSALALATSYPWRWMGVGATGFAFVNAFDRVQALQPLVKVAHGVVAGRYGLVTLLTGTVIDPLWSDVRTAEAGAWLGSVWIWGVAAVCIFLLAAWRQPEG
jgi:hypothetical protein